MTGSLQEKNNKFYMVLYVKGDDNKRKAKWIKTGLDVKGNYKKASRMLEQTIEEYQKLEEQILFSDYILSWLENRKYTIKQNTFRSYKLVIETHIAPYFKEHNITLQELKAHDLQQYYNYKIENGLSPNTVLKHHANIHKCLKYALIDDLIPYNPADRVELPKKIKFKSNVLSFEELQKVFVITQNTNIETPVYLTINLALRRSEVLGLQWSCIDLDKKTVSIENTVVPNKGGDIFSNSTKNKTSNRTLPLADNVIEYLKHLKIQQMENKLFFGSSYINNDFICTMPDGKPIKPDYLSNNFASIIKNSDVTKIRFHDLRHSTATLLFELGYSIVEVQKWLGHSNIQTTSEVYVHLNYANKINMSDSLSKVFKAL